MAFNKSEFHHQHSTALGEQRMQVPFDFRTVSPLTIDKDMHHLFSGYHSTISTEASSVSVSPTESYNSTVLKGSTQNSGKPVPNFVESLSISLQSKTLVILVGLPATGKSTICKQLVSFINERGCFGKIYNSGKVRRLVNQAEFDDSNYFDPNNVQGKTQRDLFAVLSLDTILNDLKNNKITCGFLDATNTTLDRRQLVMERISQFEAENYFKVDNVVIFDVQANDPDIINFNIHGKAFNSDYKDKDYDFAINDFKRRTEHYYTAYNKVTQEELELYNGRVKAYVMVKNAGELYEIKNFSAINSGKKYGVYHDNDNESDNDSSIHLSSLEFAGSNSDPTIEIIEQFVRTYKENEGQQYIEALACYYGKKG